MSTKFERISVHRCSLDRDFGIYSHNVDDNMISLQPGQRECQTLGLLSQMPRSACIVLTDQMSCFVASILGLHCLVLSVPMLRG